MKRRIAENEERELQPANRPQSVPHTNYFQSVFFICLIQFDTSNC